MNYELKRRVDGEGFAVEGRKTTVGVNGEGDSAEFQAAGFFPAVEIVVSVKVVTQQRMTQSSQMCPDLMGAAGDQMNAKTGNRAAFQCFITGGDWLCPRFLMIRDTNPGMKRILYQPGVTDSLRWLHDSAYETDIVFFKLAAAEDVLQDIKRLLIFRKKAQTAGLVVQTMTGSRRESVRIGPADIFLAQIRQSDTAAGIRLHTDAGPLVNQEHVIILIYNRKGGSSRETDGRCIGNINFQALTFL